MPMDYRPLRGSVFRFLRFISARHTCQRVSVRPVRTQNSACKASNSSVNGSSSQVNGHGTYNSISTFSSAEVRTTDLSDEGMEPPTPQCVAGAIRQWSRGDLNPRPEQSMRRLYACSRAFVLVLEAGHDTLPFGQVPGVVSQCDPRGRRISASLLSSAPALAGV